ncbi:MAG: hypothetical protein J6T10_08380 [Methanobrevibacter sp.]|nr:hypothetical protein [Methanobrevibacter sp.]
MKKFTADFETATWLEDETYVWAWATCEIGNPDNIVIGNTIESFMEWCIKNENTTLYFHNLKFDGEFIICYLLNNGYEYIEDRKDKKDKTFTTLISDMGLFYSIEIFFHVKGKNTKKITIIDSLKIINRPVEEIPRMFGLNIEKLDLDYNTERERGYILKDYEKDYITNDVKIVALALDLIFKQDLLSMTAGSNALKDFKKTHSIRRFNRLFPELNYEVDKDMRKAYRGGFTYLNPIYKEKDVGEGVVLDVNSLYPSVMYKEPMPIGEPLFYEGKYQDDKVYPLYIQCISCAFEIKPGKIPTIQVKKTKYFLDNEYLESSDGEIISLVLSSVDLKLFLEQYDVFELKYECGWKFKAMNGIFTEYIDKWIKVKNEATITGNKGMRSLAKLMLNSLYGKFATSMDVQSKEPYIEDGIVKYKLGEKGTKKGLYLPLGIFVTSYARNKTIRTSQAIKDYSIKKYGIDKYCYSDTDSIHTTLSIEELKQFCEIDDVELGKWKHESTFSKARFVRQKCYLEMINDEVKITCAGMPKECYKYVEWNKFKQGFTCSGKLTFKHVIGGVKLVETDFTIKHDYELRRNIKNFSFMI